MTEFTSEWIAKQREIIADESLSWRDYEKNATCNYPEALDEIERLQKENKELKEFVDATRPTGICEICTSNVISRYEPLQAPVQELGMFQDLVNKWSDQYYRDTNKLKQRIAELEEALAKIANYESMRFRLSPYEYGVLEQIVGIAEHALKGEK